MVVPSVSAIFSSAVFFVFLCFIPGGGAEVRRWLFYWFLKHDTGHWQGEETFDTQPWRHSQSENNKRFFTVSASRPFSSRFYVSRFPFCRFGRRAVSAIPLRIARAALVYAYNSNDTSIYIYIYIYTHTYYNIYIYIYIYIYIIILIQYIYIYAYDYTHT